jgi:hypothetical protein
MYQVQIKIRSRGEHKEVIVGDCAGTASATYNLIGPVLKTIYEQVSIGNVSVEFLPYGATPEDDYCIVHLQARCQSRKWKPDDTPVMEVMIEVRAGPLLVELFGEVAIEVSVSYVP